MDITDEKDSKPLSGKSGKLLLSIAVAVLVLTLVSVVHASNDLGESDGAIGDVFEATYESSTLKYKILKETSGGDCEVEVIGHNSPVNLKIPATVTRNSLEYKVKSIGVSVFKNCESLKTLSMPIGLMIIGEEAFSGCKSLTQATISSGVKTIGASAFGYCKMLESVNVPSSVEHIGDYAFAGCSESKIRIEVSEANANYSSKDGMLFDKGKTELIQGRDVAAVKIPATVKGLKKWAFYGCYHLESVYFLGTDKPTFGDNSLDVGERTIVVYSKFDLSLDASVLGGYTKVIYSKYKSQYMVMAKHQHGGEITGAALVNAFSERTVSVTVCPGYEFQGLFVDGTKVLDTPGSYTIREIISDVAVTAIFKYVGGTEFTDKGLKYCIISDAGDKRNVSLVEGIDEETVDIPESVNYNGKTYKVTEIGKEAFMSKKIIKTVHIPSSIVFIGQSSFAITLSLEQITIPASVRTIGDSAFFNSGVSEVNLTNGLQYIGDTAFRYCNSLKSITIPSSVAWIGNLAFLDCNNQRLDINVSESNIRYSSKDGMLFDKDKTQLIRGIDSETVKLPTTLTTIKTWAFYECRSVQNMYVFGDAKLFEAQSMNMGKRELQVFTPFDLKVPIMALAQTTLSIHKIESNFDITIANQPGGTLSPSGVKNVVAGSSLEIEVHPSSGYKLKDLFVDNVPVTVMSGKYTIEFVAADMSVRADFEGGAPVPGNDSSALILVAAAVVGLGAVGAAVWYFKFRKP